jgi:pimeloyl-ACP methyl ester carboxylesterase
VDVPETQYADSGGVQIAYQVFGAGPPVVMVPSLVSNVELQWETELYRRWLELLGKHARVVRFDQRGTGLSDRSERMPTLEKRVDDIGAVMEGVGVGGAHVLGARGGGFIPQRFATRYPG